MKKRAGFIFAAGLCLLFAGCKTTDEPTPLSWEQQSAYFAKVRDPRLFGLGIYQTPAGVDYRGGARLHPKQAEELSMAVDEPFRPVVELSGRFGRRYPVLLDLTSSSSWMSYDAAMEQSAVPVGERDAVLVSVPGEEIANCLSVIPSIRFRQLFVERPLVYVRMASGPLGSTLSRGIEKPELTGVIGWSVLNKFECIQFDYEKGRVLLFTDEEYRPNPNRLIAELPLVKHAGVCALRAQVDGVSRLVAIDPAGDFSVASDEAAPVGELVLHEELSFVGEKAVESPGGLRVGAQLLKNYLVTISPKKGLICFERIAQ